MVSSRKEGQKVVTDAVRKYIKDDRHSLIIPYVDIRTFDSNATPWSHAVLTVRPLQATLTLMSLCGCTQLHLPAIHLSSGLYTSLLVSLRWILMLRALSRLNFQRGVVNCGTHAQVVWRREGDDSRQVVDFDTGSAVVINNPYRPMSDTDGWRGKACGNICVFVCV